MSHYNSNSTNSWQNRSNNSSGTSSLFGTPHDLLNYSSSQQLSSQNNTVSSLTGSSNSGIVNNVPNSASVYNPAASLLAQFAVNSVNFGNLAANLPAIVNANVLAAANLGAAVAANNAGSVAGGYQWHPSSQSTLQQSSNSQSSLSQINSNNHSRNNSDQRIVSIGNTNNSSNNNSNNNNNNSNSGYKSGSGINKNSSSNMSNSGDTVRPLMEIDTIRRQNNSKMNNSSSSNSKSNTSVPASSSGNNVKNGHSTSRDRDRDRTRERDRDRDRERDRERDNRRSNVNEQSPSTLTNKHNLTITTTNMNAAATNLAAANPLAQALLNQLAVQSTNNNANGAALVAALAAAQVATAQQQHKQQQKNGSPPRNNNNSSSMRRSRSPSSSSNRHTNSSSHKMNNNNNSRHSVGGISSIHNSNINNKTNTNNNNASSSSSAKQHSKSPINSSTKRLSSSNIPANANSSSTTSHHNSSTNKTASSSSSSNRYSIKVPKYPLDALTNNVSGLKARYNQLYIPSDFINVKNGWQNSLPLNRTLKFNSRCLFHIMRKDAHSIMENDAIYDPPDADHTWSVKVMLLAMPSMNELYKRSCLFAEDSSRSNDRLEHPSKVIQFLVGNKGKHELMALGGAWSASLDGPNPATNSQTLINTAIRTVKALTGIDLSPCTQWFRFLDIQYNRNEDYKTIILPNSYSKVNETQKDLVNDEADAVEKSLNGNESENGIGKKPEATLLLNDEKEVETTIIFIPNVWSLMPNSIEYQKTMEAYKNFIDNPPPPIQPTKTTIATNVRKQNDKTELKTNNQPENETIQHKQVDIKEEAKMQEDENNYDAEKERNESNEVNSIEDLTKSLKAEYGSAHKHVNGQDYENNEADENDDSESKLEPTHYSKLDVKKMKVDELRTELMARDLDTRGLKSQLINRLKEALDNEKDKDDNQTEPSPDDENMNSQDNQETTKIENIEMQSNNENSDIVYTHVNDCDIDTFQLDEKEEPVNSTPAAEKDSSKQLSASDEKLNSEKLIKQERLARNDREKMYKLPSAPHLIVHPSRTAKNSKFECQLVSLSHLLDYRKDDNKESSFEVSLFAEYFNEMLIRDFGFVIYKHLLSVRTEKDKELFALAATTSNSNHKRKLSNIEPDDDNKRAKTYDDKNDEETNKSVKESIEIQKEDSTQSKTTILLTKPKPKTVYPELLLSFTFFDINRTNYVTEKDLEDLLLCIGLSLSRSKVKALISKIIFKDNLLSYRNLTDKLPKEITETDSVRFTLPSDDEIVSSIITYDTYMKRLNPKHEPSGSGTSSFNNETGIIELNGSTIDVLNTIKSLDKSEQTVLKLDQRLKDSTDEIERLKTLNKTADRLKLRLTDELNEYKKKLREQLRTNKDIDDKYVKFKDTLLKTKSQLNKIVDDVNDVIKRGQPASSNKSKKSSSIETKKADAENSSSEAKRTNGVSVNAEDNLETNQENLADTSELNNNEQFDQTGLEQEQINENNENESNVDQEQIDENQQDEKKMDLSSNDS